MICNFKNFLGKIAEKNNVTLRQTTEHVLVALVQIQYNVIYYI